MMLMKRRTSIAVTTCSTRASVEHFSYFMRSLHPFLTVWPYADSTFEFLCEIINVLYT